MMVTFVSQCEKKAHNRTRRVLDSFANRIGDNTWQTVITNEGLNAVKKLLRKTASKNTAVACHWIRSRSRSQFLWVVGNRSKFGSDGVVPVNYTNNRIMIGEIEIMTDQYRANTQDQRLDQHLFAVGYLAYRITRKFVPGDDNLAKSAFIAGCWHDIGKIDPSFQDWLLKALSKKNFEAVPDDGQHIDTKTGRFSWQKHPRHNEISLLLFHLLFDETGLNTDSLTRAKHAIYWHHAKPLRDKNNEIKKMIGIFDKLKLEKQDYLKLIEHAKAILESVKGIANEYFQEEVPADICNLNRPSFDNIEDNLEHELPVYKRYSRKESIDKYERDIQYNAKNNLARSAVITADRLVSRLPKRNRAGTLEEHINNHSLDDILDEAFHKDRELKQHILQCLEGFKKNNPDIARNERQSEAANALADEEVTIGVLRGPAGCGKTKIALEWALNTEVKRIFWVCPRVQICEGLFKDLSSGEYLPDAKIEICTGDIKQTRESGNPVDTPEGKEFSGDIVITTIDQIVNAITTHRNVTTLMDFMNAHVVFDEYHEYINMPAFNLLFAELVECKKYQQDEDNTLPNTLLVSATPNPLFVTDFLRLKKQDIVNIESFNQRNYRIEFADYDEKLEDDTNPLFQEQPVNTFVISNTAITAQKSFINNQEKENSVLLHAKLTKADRVKWFNKAFDSFKEKGSRDYDLLRSGPVIQASLNITCDKMVTEMTHAENFLQRLGRLDRFGQNEKTNEYIIAITQAVKNGKQNDSSSRFLSSLKILQSTKAWHDFLQNELPDEAITINHIYDLYDRFYKDENCRKLIEQDLVKALKESVLRIENKLVDPVTYPKLRKDENKIKIKKYSLRGDNRFVQMAIVEVTDRKHPPKHKNEYIDDVLTYEVNRIEGVISGQKKPDQDLLTFMYDKDHKIQTMKTGKKVKQEYSLNTIRNKARDPDSPIYVSYTIDDLNLCNDTPNTYAVYYATGKRQPIGAISLNQLTSKGE